MGGIETNIKIIWRNIKRSFTRWQPVDKIPNWAYKRLDPNSLMGSTYRIVKGKHYLYKASCEDDGGDQGHNWECRLYRKRIIR